MKKYCSICGKELSERQTKYCSKKCMGLSRQNFKICPVCGKIFKDAKANETVCCSHECSKIHRSNLYQKGIYDSTMEKMHERFSEKIIEIGPEKHWCSKHWVIESPSGQVYEFDNLMNFIKTHPSLFDGSPRQAFDGFQKIKASAEGKRSRPVKSWKGWHLIHYSDNKNRYVATKKPPQD